MNSLEELYQELILEHNKYPRNFGVLENPTHKARGLNPLCGDEINLYLVVEDGKIKDIKFQGQGCAISKASASMMTEIIKGKTVEEALELYNKFHDMVTADFTEEVNTDNLGAIAVFSGVRAFPTRVKCASLAWHALEAALTGKEEYSE